MQWDAIARALTNDPDIILADEPTGALDTESSKGIMKLIEEIAEDRWVIMVTHTRALAEKHAMRIIDILDGDIIRDTCLDMVEPLMGSGYSPKKTSMAFTQALKLSINNLKKKKKK